MSSELTMPKLSDSMADAVITRWLKQPGEPFVRGDGLIEVETDKATVVYEAESDGTLGVILAPEGATVAVGEPIATIASGEGADGERRGSASPELAAASPSPPAGQPAAGVHGGRAPNATPVAKRIAVELGVALHGVVGTGPGGRITREDVEKAADGSPREPVPVPAPAGGRGETRVLELTATQATIARRMVESATTVPVFTASADIDMSLIVALRSAREMGGDIPSLNDFVVKAAALTLREYPRFNASYVDGTVECYSRVNVGVAVATDGALLVPVVLDADRRSIAEIAAETRRLADLARRRALSPDAMHDGTFTISNLGMYGLRSFTAIVDPPQAAILAVGGVRRAAVEDATGDVGFRDLMTVTLSCDHRVVYGADAAQFLSRLRELLERPLALVTEGR